MDLDDVEIVDLRTLGGADRVTVDGLSGTDVTDIRTDIGAADGQADAVTVNGTAGDDAVVVISDGPIVVVQGLAAAVRVANAEPTLDRLTVNGLAGNGTVTASPEAGGLIGLELVP